MQTVLLADLCHQISAGHCFFPKPKARGMCSDQKLFCRTLSGIPCLEPCLAPVHSQEHANTQRPQAHRSKFWSSVFGWVARIPPSAGVPRQLACCPLGAKALQDGRYQMSRKRTCNLDDNLDSPCPGVLSAFVMLIHIDMCECVSLGRPNFVCGFKRNPRGEPQVWGSPKNIHVDHIFRLPSEKAPQKLGQVSSRPLRTRPAENWGLEPYVSPGLPVHLSQVSTVKTVRNLG